MMKLAVIGNSHAGALKLAWDDLAGATDGVEAEFFAAPGAVYRSLTVFGDRRFGVAHPESHDPDKLDMVKQLNGKSDIALSGFDHVLIAGHGFQPLNLLGLLGRSDVERLRETDAPALLSRPAFEAVLDDLAANYMPNSGWYHWDTPRVWIVDRPRPAESQLASARVYQGLRKNVSGLAEALAESTLRNRAALEKVGVGYIAQPADTLAASGLTLTDYTRGSKRLDPRGAHPENDHVHMNAAYGLRQWQEILETLLRQK